MRKKYLWDENDKNDFLESILAGFNIVESLERNNLSERGFFDACNNDPDFENKFGAYTKHGLKMIASGLLNDIDNPDKDVARTKLKLEHVRWLLTRLIPETYGDKMKVQIEHVDLSGALLEAKNRSLEAIEAEYTQKDPETPSCGSEILKENTSKQLEIFD